MSGRNSISFFPYHGGLQVSVLMELFEGGDLEKKIMDKVGCLNYSVTQWEAVRPNVYDRDIRYKFNRHMSIFGGEAVSSQQKTPTADGNGWIVDEVMTIHNVPFGDHFRVCFVHRDSTYVLDFQSLSHSLVGSAAGPFEIQD